MSIDCQPEKDFRFVLRLNRKSRLPNFSTPIACLQQIHDASSIRSSLAVKEFERGATFRCYLKNLSVDLAEDVLAIPRFAVLIHSTTSRDIFFHYFQKLSCRRSKRLPRLRRTPTKNFLIYDPILQLAEHVQRNPIPLYPVIQRYRMTAVSITSCKKWTRPDVLRRWKMEMVARCDSLDATPQNLRS